MRRLPKLLAVSFSAALSLSMPAAAAEPQTVCTVTVNSADEREAFRRHLPAAKYQFVELVERGRPDWLASACRAAVSCDVLVISGHYDGSTEFFSDQLDVQEYLPVAELERVSCSGACPGLFDRLKEVYLFGCNTLNPRPLGGASAEIVRSLVREGHTRQEAERELQSLNADLGESSRERMRQIFKDVPVIYGFSSVAPLGPTAATALNGYFRTTGVREVGQGQASSRLLEQFAPFGMSAAAGTSDKDPHIGARQDMCRFADDRLSDATRLAFVHELLQRHTTETRMYLDRIQRFMATLQSVERRDPAVARALGSIARDTDARTRHLDFARRDAVPESRVRWVALAHELGWLTDDQQRDELALMLGELQARSTIGPAEVALACTLNQTHELEGAFNRRVTPGGPADDVPHAAVRACLGSAEGHARTLQGLLGADEADARVVQTYLRHRPITDSAELRRLAEGISRMDPSDAQVRALESLGRHYVADREVLELLVRLFVQTPSASVQAAIAGVLIRADLRPIAGPQLLRAVQEGRHPAPPGDSMIDALIRRLALH